MRSPTTPAFLRGQSRRFRLTKDDAPHVRANGAAEIDTGCRDDAPFYLTADGGLLSMEAENVCLGKILEALADRGYAGVHLPPSFADKPVSASFENVPLKQAVERILQDTSYALQTRGKEGSTANRPSGPEKVEIWLIPGGSAAEALLPDRGAGSAGRRENIDLAAVAEDSRFSPEPEVRAYAVQLMTQTEDRAKAAEFILAGLRDPAPQVRRTAIGEMAGLDKTAAAEAVDLVADIALHDESPELRKQALLKLIDEEFRSEATARVVTDLMYDEDPVIKKLAKDLSVLVNK